jgi:Mg-chelatase subunit ChlI
LHVFWFANNLVTISQNVLFSTPAVLKAFKIPDINNIQDVREVQEKASGLREREKPFKPAVYYSTKKEALAARQAGQNKQASETGSKKGKKK